MFILDDLFLSPFKGLWFIFNEIKKRAEAELYDESLVQKQLLRLELENEMEGLDRNLYEQKRDELLERLKIIRERKPKETKEVYDD